MAFWIYLTVDQQGIEEWLKKYNSYDRKHRKLIVKKVINKKMMWSSQIRKKKLLEQVKAIGSEFKDVSLLVERQIQLALAEITDGANYY